MIIIALLCISAFSIIAPKVRADPEELLSLPAGATNCLNGRDTETILLNIDVDSETPGDQQIVATPPGETISVTATFQVWCSSGPGPIKQAFFIYSWTPSWPPSSMYYMPLYNGQPGYYPGLTLTTSFSLTVPEDEGNHYLWFCLGAHYSMELAVNEYKTPLTLPAHAKIVVGAPPRDLDPTEYCPYVYLDNGYGLPWDTTPDLPVNVLYTGTYFWGDLRVIQYWFHWNIDYMWWLSGFAKSAYEYTKGWGWHDPLRQTTAEAGGADWEPIIVIVDDEGSIDYVLWRWHYIWLKFDLTVPFAELFHPTYDETHIKLWWAIGSHTPLTKYFATDIPILLKIASLLKTPEQFSPVIGQQGDFTKPPLYNLYEQGITYPCGMQEWDEELALSLGFEPSDLKYVNNPTIAYSELQPWKLFEDLLSVILDSPGNILVTAPNDLRVGYDSATQTIVNEIEGATYSGPRTEPQVVSIPSPLPGVYDIDIVGTDSGVYTITIWSMAEDASLGDIEANAGETVEGEVDHYSASISETGEMEVFSWEHVFEDTKRGTMLKISTDDKCFQFIAPDKDFGVKYDANMIILKRVIIICYEDSEMRLITIAVDTKLDFCYAMAWDMQTRKCYLLIDKAGIEK